MSVFLSNFTIIDSNYQSSESFASIFERKEISDFEIIESKSNYSSSNCSNGIHYAQNQLNLWNTIKKGLSDLTNLLKFNILSNETKMDLTNVCPIQIYNKKYKAVDPKDNKYLINELKNIIWFSYRTNFDGIIYDSQLYTSDAGWGCMIRVGQMILAKGLYNLYKYDSIDSFCETKLLLFADNPISSDDLIKAKLSHQDVIIFGNNKQSKAKVTPPYSIRQICQMNTIQKGPGDWFSNYDIMAIFKDITNKYNPLPNVKLFNFSQGAVYIQDIINECFEKAQCTCSGLTFEHIISEIAIKATDFDFEVIEKGKYVKNICQCNKKTILFKDERYTMKHSFLMFISVRHGLYEIEEETKGAIFDYFNLTNNLGMIGGKVNRALYFIGYCQKNLIFVDPHFINETCNTADLLEKKGKDTYIPADYYYMNINQMSPSFTMGFYCNTIEEYDKIITELEAYTKIDNKLFDLKLDRCLKKSSLEN